MKIGTGIAQYTRMISSSANNATAGQVYERRNNGHVFLKAESSDKAKKQFRQLLSKAMGTTVPEQKNDEMPSGKALAQWARQVMAAADRRLIATFTSNDEPSAFSRMPFIPHDLNTAGHVQQSVSAEDAASKYRQKDTDFRSFIQQAADIYRIPKSLIKAVIQAESAFNSKAVSPAGAQGLMQLMPATAKSLGVTNSFDPEQNIKGGSRYLRMMLNRYDNNLTKALAAYNWGPHRVDRGLKNMPAETRNYIKTILKDLGI